MRRKDNGRIEYRFMIGDKRYSVSGKTATECKRAEQAKREAVAAAAVAGYIRNDDITVEQYFREWMAGKAGTVKESTIHQERKALKPVMAIIGAERVQALERRRIIALQGELLEAGNAPQTVNYKIAMLKSLLKSAVIDGIITRNPAEGIKPLRREAPPARETIHRALTREEQAAFFTAARGSWYYHLFRFLVLTGARIGEAGALRWTDIDSKNGVIHIRRTLTTTAEGIREGTDTKSRAGIRDIPMTEPIRAALREQREQMAAFFGNQVMGNVFLSLNGYQINATAVQRHTTTICEKAGIERVSNHAFRDTFATRAIECGMTPNTLKTILGHSTLSMTMDLYAHVLPNTRAEEMQKIVIGI